MPVVLNYTHWKSLLLLRSRNSALLYVRECRYMQICRLLHHTTWPRFCSCKATALRIHHFAYSTSAPIVIQAVNTQRDDARDGWKAANLGGISPLEHRRKPRLILCPLLFASASEAHPHGMLIGCNTKPESFISVCRVRSPDKDCFKWWRTHLSCLEQRQRSLSALWAVYPGPGNNRATLLVYLCIYRARVSALGLRQPH